MSDPAIVLPLRRLGSGVIHFVAIRPASLGVGHFVTDFLGTEAPVVSLCMAHLNGTKVWMQKGKPCAKCSRIATSRGLTVEFYEPTNGRSTDV